ncbi:ubiquitin carboxyl-terminal hydrolase 40-like isoform X2 [Tachypleus tridentatus]|uniref:ubiquitin carboxyl-terminal hydrolase 40-like isoform X2 n=2 Tax=Tachypleus tridentatus TaxID=6853 RepID=UPI003FD002A0
MFGNLFEEENRHFTKGDSKTVSLGILKPMPPRPPCGLCGIENQGATCYLNSLLQTLLFTPEFREGLFQVVEDELGSVDSHKARIIPLQLQRLFSRLLLSNSLVTSTTELTDSFGWANNEELQQHDVQELNRILFSAIENSLVGTSGKSLISQLYRGSTVNQITCQLCGKVSEREEDFLDLNVIVTGYSSLQDSLNNTYLHRELMKGKNQYHCSSCNQLVNAKKGARILKLPQILSFSLLRFNYDFSKGERIKETGKFSFPLEIDMAPYCEKNQKTGDNVSSHYELFSVLIHSGSSHGGHYHAYIRDVDCLGKWMPPEEEPIHLSRRGKHTENKWDLVQFDNPVDLVKGILIQQTDHCLLIDILCSELVKQSGVSWNKRFKRQYGPISKFLLKHDDVFFLNQSTNIVYLKDWISPDSKQLSTSLEKSSQSGSGNTSQQDQFNSPTHGCYSQVGCFSNIHTKKSTNQKFGYNWFDFNDSRVSPIYARDIEKQFSGRESAYMLFYRRKLLQRPLEARGNPSYLIPQKLIDLVKQENEELQKQREAYEVALNTITVQIHFGINHQYHQGALHPLKDTLSVVDLKIDYRKTLACLRSAIMELGQELCPTSDFIIHVVQELPAGLHLYEELTFAQDTVVLKDLGILTGTKLFVWDGKQINGEIPLIGSFHEPILLNVTCFQPGGMSREITRGFPKSLTVGELRVILTELTQVQLENLNLSKIQLEADENREVLLGKEHNGKTLTEMGLLDGDCLYTFSELNRDVRIDKKNCSMTIKVFIQNKCETNGDQSASENSEIELEVRSDDTVEKLKLMALSKLELKNSVYRLRKHPENIWRKPPLHDSDTLKDAGICDGTLIILEDGSPPKSDEITLFFSVGAEAGDQADFEVNVEKQASVSHCLKSMLCTAEIEGDGWHICRTNWCGESMEPLHDENTTVEEEGLQHGDFLLLEEGRLPPHGYLTLAIWLHKTPESIEEQENKVEDLSSALKEIWNIIDTPSGTYKLGEVEISAESSLADLKHQILTLPALSTISLPNVRYLRLRHLEGGSPGKVLRGLNNTLRKLKLTNHQNLCLQLLVKDEDLLQHDILLNICRSIPDTRCHTPPVEMLWAAGKSATFQHLCQSLSVKLGIPSDRLVMAKHFKEKFEWLVISENANHHKSRSPKRWGNKKIHLRLAPFSLKDGDLLGIKDILYDPGGKDDFSTMEDDEGKRMLEEKARERRQNETATLDGNNPSCCKQPEMGITIHVDNFS